MESIKVEYLELNQGTSVTDVRTLGPEHCGFYTGLMGDCVSVIVLWPYDSFTHTYANGRGMHGSGGAGAVQWLTLLAGVPNTSTTVVYAIGGNIKEGNIDCDCIAEKIELFMKQATLTIYKSTKALVNKTGIVELNTEPPAKGAKEVKRQQRTEKHIIKHYSRKDEVEFITKTSGSKDALVKGNG